MKHRNQTVSRSLLTLILIVVFLIILTSSCEQLPTTIATASANPPQLNDKQPTISLLITSEFKYTATATDRIVTQDTSVTSIPGVIPFSPPTTTPTARSSNTPNITDVQVMPTSANSIHSPLIVTTVMTRGGKKAIYTIRPDGTGLTSLDPGPVGSYSAQWSPDGRKIAYLSGDSGEAARLIILDYESGSRQQVNYLGVSIYSWSPDSKTLVFTTEPNTQDKDYYIYLVNLSDLGLEPLYKMPHNKRIVFLDWSPKGDKILTVFQDQSTMTFLRLFTLSGDYITINTGHILVYDAVWNPTGEVIAFSGTDFSDNSNGMWLISSNSTQSQPILGDQDVFSLDWSPDGRMVAFSSSCCDQPSLISVLYLGTKLVQPITATESFAYAPSWSPDGVFLAYLTTTEDVITEGYSLNIFSLATNSFTQILKEKVSGGISWRP